MECSVHLSTSALELRASRLLYRHNLWEKEIVISIWIEFEIGGTCPRVRPTSFLLFLLLDRQSKMAGMGQNQTCRPTQHQHQRHHQQQLPTKPTPTKIIKNSGDDQWGRCESRGARLINPPRDFIKRIEEIWAEWYAASAMLARTRTKRERDDGGALAASSTTDCTRAFVA